MYRLLRRMLAAGMAGDVMAARVVLDRIAGKAKRFDELDQAGARPQQLAVVFVDSPAPQACPVPNPPLPVAAADLAKPRARLAGRPDPGWHHRCQLSPRSRDTKTAKIL